MLFSLMIAITSLLLNQAKSSSQPTVSTPALASISLSSSVPTNSTTPDCAQPSVDPNIEQGEDHAYLYDPRPSPSTTAPAGSPRFKKECQSLATPSSSAEPSVSPLPQSEVFTIGYHSKCSKSASPGSNTPCRIKWAIYSDWWGVTINPCDDGVNKVVGFGGDDPLDDKGGSFPKMFNGFGNQLAHGCTWTKASEEDRGILTCSSGTVTCVKPDLKEMDQRCEKGVDWFGVDICIFSDGT